MVPSFLTYRARYQVPLTIIRGQRHGFNPTKDARPRRASRSRLRSRRCSRFSSHATTSSSMQWTTETRCVSSGPRTAVLFLIYYLDRNDHGKTTPQQKRRYSMTSSALASNIGGTVKAKRFASKQMFQNICPAYSGREDSSTTIRDVMSRPYVAAIVLTRSSGIDCENSRVRHHCQFGRTFDPCGSRARVVHLRTRWHRLEVVVVFSQPRSW